MIVQDERVEFIPTIQYIEAYKKFLKKQKQREFMLQDEGKRKVREAKRIVRAKAKMLASGGGSCL